MRLKCSVVLMLLFSVFFVQSSCATFCYSKEMPDGRYLSVEAYCDYVEIWTREQPYSCSYNDEIKARMNPKELGDALGVSIDTLSFAYNCGGCVFWTRMIGTGTVTGCTLTVADGFPGDEVAGCSVGLLLDLEFLNRAAGSCSACGHDITLKIYNLYTEENESKIPQLLSPRAREVMDNGCTDRSDSIVWDFDWADIPGATEYNLYIKHKGSKYSFVDVDTTRSSYHYVGRGSYIVNRNRFDWGWKVRAYVDGQWYDYSNTRYFNVEPVNTD